MLMENICNSERERESEHWLLHNFRFLEVKLPVRNKSKISISTHQKWPVNNGMAGRITFPLVTELKP